MFFFLNYHLCLVCCGHFRFWFEINATRSKLKKKEGSNKNKKGTVREQVNKEYHLRYARLWQRLHDRGDNDCTRIAGNESGCGRHAHNTQTDTVYIIKETSPNGSRSKAFPPRCVCVCVCIDPSFSLSLTFWLKSYRSGRCSVSLARVYYNYYYD